MRGVSGPEADGSPEAVLGAVFRAEYRSLVGLARLLADDDAEPIVQEAFVRTLTGWERLRNREDPLPYLRQTVVNLARGTLRRRRTARRQPPAVAPAVTDPQDATVDGEDRRALLGAIAALPARQREVVVLRYYLECSTDETARALGISTGSVKTHLHRALHAIEATVEATR